MARGQETRENINNSNRRKKAKNSTRFQPYMRGKLVVFCVLIALAAIGLTAVLIHITSTSEAKYKKQVLSQQSYDSAVLPYKRGSILDANGSILAYSEKVYNVIIDAAVMNHADGVYIEPTLAAIDACFDVNIDEIRDYVKTNTSSRYCKILELITYEEKVAYESYVSEIERLGKEAAAKEGKKYDGTYISGIWFEEEYIRRYRQEASKPCLPNNLCRVIRKHR